MTAHTPDDHAALVGVGIDPESTEPREQPGWMCDDSGRYHRNTYDGWGFARCSCGQVSEVLGSTNGRKQWHREHKAAVLAEAAS